MNTQEQTLGFWNKLFGGDIEHNRFGIISMVLLIVGCLGGLTVGLGAINHTWQLFLVVIPTMTTLSLLLAVAPVKYILNLALITIVIDLLILVFNIMS